MFELVVRLLEVARDSVYLEGVEGEVVLLGNRHRSEVVRSGRAGLPLHQEVALRVRVARVAGAHRVVPAVIALAVALLRAVHAIVDVLELHDNRREALHRLLHLVLEQGIVQLLQFLEVLQLLLTAKR